jgi:hypothetical protein
LRGLNLLQLFLVTGKRGNAADNCREDNTAAYPKVFLIHLSQAFQVI